MKHMPRVKQADDLKVAKELAKTKNLNIYCPRICHLKFERRKQKKRTGRGASHNRIK
jgi:hypothetical protein